MGMIDYDLLDELVKDKDIVLIGHSPTIMKRKRNIERFDTIVRFNYGVPKTEQYDYIGKRTDIWFHWDGYDYEKENKLINPKVRIRPQDYPGALFTKLREEQGQQKAPCMGMLGLAYLLEFKPKSVSMYGFDFFRTADFTDTELTQSIHVRDNPCHDFVKEERWFWNTKPSFVKFYNENNKEEKTMPEYEKKQAKTIKNKAIQEPKESKVIKCKGCDRELIARGCRFGCPQCNTVNG